MMFEANKFRRRANVGSLGALLLCLTFFLTLGWAQEAPRQEGSTQIKPPMIKPPMRSSKNTNSGSVNSSSRRKKRRSSKQRTRSRAKVTKPPVVPTSESILTVSEETRDTEASIKPPMANSDSAPVANPSGEPINGGILNSKALSLPRPIYPPMARAARASGTVVVQVIIDEEGRVISAKAISGHPLLQSAAVEAAQKARFAPTRLKGQPVKVTGTLSYYFTQ